MNLRKIILIKHSIPKITSEIPSNQWTLSEEGIKHVKLLAPKIKNFNFDKIFSSVEPKAIETAQILGKKFSKKIEIIEGIHEHERESNRIIYQRNQWLELMEKFFRYPDKLIFGDETATAAKERFSLAIHNLVHNNPPDKDIVVITHGTVMSLFISKYNVVDIFEIWNALGLPSYVELTAKEFSLESIVNIS